MNRRVVVSVLVVVFMLVSLSGLSIAQAPADAVQHKLPKYLYDTDGSWFKGDKGVYISDVAPRAQFSLNKDLHWWTEDDAITSGAYELNIGYWMDIYNENDTSDTVLGNLSFAAQANNITDVDWEEYAEWNESYVEWNFPAYPEFIIDEDEGFGTGFDTSYSEIKDVNVDLSRWMNITVFNSDAYQLAEFTITFREGDFMWCWGDIEVNEHHEVRASIVPNTFYTDAPLDWFDVEEDGVHFNFDKGQMQKDIPYNFTVVIKVELTGNEAPPIRYKPEFYIGQGIYYKDFTLAGKRHTAEMPEGMLPDNVSYASVITNVSNYWTLKRHNQIITVLGEVVELVDPHAEFSLDKNFCVGTQNDSITSGTYNSSLSCHMDIYNEDDDSDTVLGNLTFIIKTENITGVDWRKYAKWNESYAEWEFPPEFVIEEDEGFGTGLGTSYLEPKYFNLNIIRWFNQTSFNETAYQLVNFSVEFEDKNFEWLWGGFNANEHEEVYASIVPGTFETNAPINGIEEEEHEIHFDFDEDALQSGVTYNFSFVVKVEPRRPVIYKPDITIGEGLYSNSTVGGIGHTSKIPSYMLPKNVSYASAKTNVSNAWRFGRYNHLIAGLGEVVELAGPHAEFHFNKDFNVWTRNNTITNGIYESDKWYWMHIENVEDTGGVALGNLSFSATADNITDVDWEEYAEWNESYVEWNFSAYPEFIIDEDEGFGTGFSRGSEIRDVNMSVSRWMNITEFDSSSYQLAKFNVTFDDTNFEWVWARIEANEHHEIEASIVPGTFTYDAPLGCLDEWDHGIHFDFDEEQIQIGVPYNFSVMIKVELTGEEIPPILYKPRFEIGVGLYYNSTTGAGDKIEIPADMLPEHVYSATASTNVTNTWLIKRHNQIIAGLDEVHGSTRIEAWIFDVYMNPLPTMPNATFSKGSHENLRGLFNRIENPTSTSILSPSILLETLKPVWHYETADVEKFSYDFISDNSSKFNWSLHDIPPHEGAGSMMVVWSEMESKDYGYEASVSVDKFEFSSPSEQNLNITVDVYDNSSMEELLIEAYPFDEDVVENHDFVFVEFTGWSSDITPAHFTADHAAWSIQNPEAKRYTFSVNVSVTPHLSCAYKPGVDVIKFDFVDEYLVNSSSEITHNTWAGDYTISMDEARDWVIYRGDASVSSFPMIAAENHTTISGYVKGDDGNPIENTIVSVNRWDESEYQDYVETSTNESGYYEAYVKGGEKYKITAGWTRPDYTTEEVGNITILPHIENFTLHNASVVCGGVFDASKKPMQGVNVMVVDESDIAISGDWTNEDGYYRQLKIPEYGNYTVKVEGYGSNELELSDVGKGKAVLHNFVVVLRKGDLNSDGEITPADAVIALEIAAGSRPCDASDARAHADVSGDNRVTSLDALMILQAAAGSIEIG